MFNKSRCKFFNVVSQQFGSSEKFAESGEGQMNALHGGLAGV